MEQAACSLRDELQALKNPADRTTLWAGSAISGAIGVQAKDTGEQNSFARYLRDLSFLIDAVGKAKTSYPYVLFAQKKGTPSGPGKFGMALTKFIAHLEFTALAAGGDWSLDKNKKSGTLIDAIEKLRKFLPSNLLPAIGQHPCPTYQKILTDVRFEWNLGRFPWPKLDQKS